MIIKDSEAIARLNSPMNLINKLRSGGSKNSAMSLFGIGLKNNIESKTITKQEAFSSFKDPFKIDNPTEIPNEDTAEIVITKQETNITNITNMESLDTILSNGDSQIKLGLAHDKAVDLLHDAVNLLATKLDDVKADKLPSVISAASKTVESIRRERIEASKNNKDKEVHFHFYTPEQKKLESYEVIDVQ